MNTDFQPNTEGAWFGLADRTYRHAPGVSQSMLKHLALSPAHFQVALVQPPAPTADMIFGSILHHVVLTPDDPPFWTVAPDGMNFRTKEGIQWKKDHASTPIIKTEDWERVLGAASAIRDHPKARVAIQGRAEVSIFRNWKFTEMRAVMRKGRIDVAHAIEALVDLKTTQDARPEAFSRDIQDLKYYLQAAYYLDLWNETFPRDPRQFFAFIAVEKVPPYGIVVYTLHQAAIEAGRNEYQDLLARYCRCEATGNWPAYPTEVFDINLPPYFYRQTNHSAAWEVASAMVNT